MPHAVKAAYRQPIDLLGLLSSNVYGDEDRKQVRDDLLEALTGDFGVVHLPHGANQTRTLSQRAKDIKDPVLSIGLVLAVEDYGGNEQTMPYLARAMEPRWLAFWNSMNWKDRSDIRSCLYASHSVFGQRQLAWLAAQYARSVIEFARSRNVVLRAIESAESWAINPTGENKERAREAAGAANASAANAAAYADAKATYAAWAAAANAAHAADNAYYAVYAAWAANTAYATAYASSGNRASAYPRLCELTKWLITPSLLEAR